MLPIAGYAKVSASAFESKNNLGETYSTKCRPTNSSKRLENMEILMAPLSWQTSIWHRFPKLLAKNLYFPSFCEKPQKSNLIICDP